MIGSLSGVCVILRTSFQRSSQFFSWQYASTATGIPHNFSKTHNVLKLAGLPLDRRWFDDLKHYRWCCVPSGGPQTMLIVSAIEWDPYGTVVLRANGTPFSRKNFLALMNWISEQRPWDREWIRPLALSEATRAGFSKLHQFARFLVSLPTNQTTQDMGA